MKIKNKQKTTNFQKKKSKFMNSNKHFMKNGFIGQINTKIIIMFGILIMKAEKEEKELMADGLIERKLKE